MDMKATQNQKAQTVEFANVPTEGKWFLVNPLKINQNLFKEKRLDWCQEDVRRIILMAFQEMKDNPKYARKFKTMIPKKNWQFATVGQLKEIARNLGDHNADWVEQALEWAQRIANGESWRNVCNVSDTANWHRLVVWGDECSKLVGGSRSSAIDLSSIGRATTIFSIVCMDSDKFKNVVPLVVSYDV